MEDSHRRTPGRDAFQARVARAVDAIETTLIATKGMVLAQVAGNPDSEDYARFIDVVLTVRDLAIREQDWARQLAPAPADPMLDRYRLVYRLAMGRLEVRAGLLMAAHPDDGLADEMEEFLKAWKEWSTA